MVSSSAHIATRRPTRFLERLCKHIVEESRFAHEVDVTFDVYAGLVGFIDFAPVASGTCRLDARQDGVLKLEATGRDPAALERIQRVLTHLVERFGRRDGLTVEWGPSSENGGSIG
jgi:hypothetical protein